MKILALFLASFLSHLLILPINVHSTTIEHNLLLNGDFSQQSENTNGWHDSIGADHWRLWFPSDIRPKVRVTEENSIEISSNQVSRAAVFQEGIPVLPNTEYRAIVEVKTTDISNVLGGRIRVQYMENGTQISLYSSEAVSGTSGWESLAVTFTTGADTEQVKLELFFDNTSGLIEYRNARLYDRIYEEIQEIIISQEELRLQIGERQLIELETYPEDFPRKNLTFSSSDPKVAQVNERGYVTGVASGTSEIIISDKNETIQVSIPIFVTKDRHDNVHLTLDQMHIIPLFQPLEELNFFVENQDLLEVFDGIILPKKEGTTRIKITNKSDELIVLVDVSIDKSDHNKFDDMRTKWHEMILGANYFDSDDSLMIDKQRSMDRTANLLWETLNKDEDKEDLWDEQSELTSSANLTRSFRNLTTLALSATNPHSENYLNRKLLEDIFSGLDWMYSYKYNLSVQTHGNWWDWEIGVPRAINDLVTTLHPFLSQEQIGDFLRPIDRFLPDVNYNRYSVNPELALEATGANQVDNTRIILIKSILEEKDSGVSEAISALEKVYPFVNEGDGFYTDGSFLQHDNVPYIGSYGNVLLDGISQIFTMTQSTDYFPDDNIVKVIDFWIQESIVPFVHKGNMMDMVRGRAISRSQMESNVAGAEMTKAMIRFASISELTNSNSYFQFAKHWIKANSANFDYLNSLSSFRDIALAKTILSNPDIASDSPYTTKLTNFANMDRMTYFNKDFDFIFGLSMSSSRIKRYETMNNENLQGWHTGDGMLYLYNDDLNQFNQDFWATVDPYRLPGITVDKQARLDQSGYSVAETDFVGGSTVDDRYGSFVMDFINYERTLTAQKSWFILGDELVAIGSNINFQNDRIIETVIENRKLNETINYRFFVNNEQIDLSNGQQSFSNVESVYFEASDPQQSIGYKFINPQDLTLMIEERTDSWNRINGSGSTDPITRSYFTMWKTHIHQEDEYNYAIYPSRERNEFEKIEPAKILRNDKNIHAVQSNNVIGINVYNDTEVEILDMKFQTPMSLTRVDSDETIILSHSDPTMKRAQKDLIHLKDDGYRIKEADSNISAKKVTSLDGLDYWEIEIDPTGSNGQNSQILFNKK